MKRFTEAAAIERVVTEFGMWLVDSGQRLARCNALANDGATAADIQAVCDFVERAAGHDLEKTGARLNRILRPGEWREAQRAASAARTRQETTEHYPNMAPHDSVPRDPNRDAAMAYARIAFDGHEPAQIAGDLGISITQLAVLVREGAKQYPNEDPERAVEVLLATQKEEA